MGIGFAIPSSMAKHVMNQLRETGSVTRGFLGIAPQDLDKELAASFKLDKAEGVLVAQVEKGSPAEQAGLKQGDVILKINDIVMKSVGLLRKTVALMDPGATVDLAIWRNGETLHLKITIGTHPSSPSNDMVQLFDKLGFEVKELTSEYADELGYKNEKGVLVSKVDPRSLAAMAGLRPGSLIKAVNRKEVTSLLEFFSGLKDAMKEDRILLLVKQGQVTRFVSIRIEQ